MSNVPGTRIALLAVNRYLSSSRCHRKVHMKAITEIVVIDADNIACVIIERCFRHVGYQGTFIFIQTAAAAKEYLTAPVEEQLILLEPLLPDIDTENFITFLLMQSIHLKNRVYFISAILPEIVQEMYPVIPGMIYLPKPFTVQYALNLLHEGNP